MDTPASRCLFCRIVAGEIPALRVLETDDAVAFLDIAPVNPGHVLLVPKAHHPDLDTLPDALAAATATLLPRLSRAVRAATGADGLNVVINNGAVAGQTIGHGHWHLIPRFAAGDTVRWPWPHAEVDAAAMARLHAAIAERVRAEPH